MKTGFSLLGKVHREIPVFITGMGLQCGLFISKEVKTHRTKGQLISKGLLAFIEFFQKMNETIRL